MVLVICCCVFQSGCQRAESVDTQFIGEVEHGTLDLSRWLPEKKSVIHFDGNWTFYWQKLLTPDSFKETPPPDADIINVPGLWNRYKKNVNRWPGDGFATYRLMVNNIPESTNDYYLLIPEIPTASTLWINGIQCYRQGIVATTKEKSRPFLKSGIIRVEPSKERTLDLLLQVSNFSHKDGGIWSSFKFGTETLHTRAKEFPSLFDMFIFGTLFIMSLYHIGLFALRSKDRASLYFGIFCLLVAGRSLMVGQRILFRFLETGSWVLRQRVEYAFFFLSVPAFIMFFYYLFPKSLPKPFCRSITGIAIVFLLFTLFLPLKMITYSGNIFQVIMIVSALYILVVTLDLARKGTENSRLFLCGYILLFTTVINDLFYSHLLLYTRSLIHFGVFLFILFQALLLSNKNARNIRAVETVSEELEHKNKELIRLNRLKDEFLANTSHELKTPLHGIMGLSDALLDSPAGTLSGEQKSILKMISGSGRRLFNLINDLLDFSRVQRNDLKLHKKSTDIGSLIDSVVTFIRPVAGEKSVELTLSLPENIPPVLCDENRIQQVLFNLIENAVKYTPEGCVDISVTPGRHTVTISVKDTGIGIEKEKLTRIFKSFEQGYDHTAHYFQGIGLGLAISKRMIELHDSQLIVESRPGTGSCFSFSLPVTNITPEKTRQPAITGNRFLRKLPSESRDDLTITSKQTEKKERNGKHILIVDDEPVNVKLVSHHLSRNGFDFSIANDGYEALEMIDDTLPDLVLLDIMMPGMSGYDVCRKLRATYPAFELPVIMLTAKNRLDDVVKGFQCGANDYIPKPFFKEELLARINTQIEAGDSITRLKNNKLLKKEIARRQTVEDKLMTLQRRMIRIIDASSEAILAVNLEGTILFCNQQAEKQLACSTSETVNQPIEILFNPKGIETIFNALNEVKKASGTEPKRQKEEFSIKKGTGETVTLTTLLVSFLVEGQPMATLVFNPGKTEVETALNELPELMTTKSRPALAGLREISPLLDSIQDRLPPADNTDKKSRSREEALRESLVALLTRALHLWETTTGKTKIDLAEESALWNVYLDRGTYKTRTLDKYLSLKTLPKRPRWREIIKTASFVISHCELSDKDHDGIKAMILRAESHLGNR